MQRIETWNYKIMLLKVNFYMVLSEFGIYFEQ